MLALAGICCGMMLGEMAAGTRLRVGVGEPASYSHLSANPDALAPPGSATVPCPGCSDSYGVGARLRADHESRMSDEFRELGAVDVDMSPSADPVDDYRYGGRFPDPERSASDAPTALNDWPAAAPASETSPADTAEPSTANY